MAKYLNELIDLAKEQLHKYKKLGNKAILN